MSQQVGGAGTSCGSCTVTLTVAIRSHRDLRAWQQADVLRRKVILLCSEPAVKRDFEFCDQAQRAASSACRNLAEGFARYRHLAELLDSLDEALAKQYIDTRQFEVLDADVRVAMRSANGLRRYLHHTPTPREHLSYSPRSKKSP